MLSQELWLENERKCAMVRKSKPGRKRQELLAIAFGVKVGLKGGFLWSPLKLFACSQISSLVRRAALTHDNHFNYEKTHNFKVSVYVLSAALRGRGSEDGRGSLRTSIWSLVRKTGGSKFLCFPHNPLPCVKLKAGESSWLHRAALNTYTCTDLDLGSPAHFFTFPCPMRGAQKIPSRWRLQVFCTKPSGTFPPRRRAAAV